MRVYSSTVALVASLSLQVPFSSGFVPSRVASSRTSVADQRQQLPSLCRLHHVLYSTSTEDNETASPVATKKKKKLGLITFDLDDVRAHVVLFLYFDHVQLANSLIVLQYLFLLGKDTLSHCTSPR